MDPEDVLDFGEDEDGLDVISLGASDHDGRPVSRRSSSTLPDYASRGTPHLRPSSPSRVRHRKSPNPQLNGAERSHGQSTSRTQDLPQAPRLARRNSNSHRPAPRSHRPLRDSASRDSNRAAIIEPPRTRLPSDRPKPGERASYMPPDRLSALAHSPRTADLVKSSNNSRRPLPSLSTRITDHRHVEPKEETQPSSSKPIHESDKSERPIEVTKPVPQETIEVKKPVSEETKELKKPAHSSVPPSTENLPEGWIARISKAGKTYYVNVFTRTSQWARPTEPAIGKQLKPTGKQPQVTSKSSGSQPVPTERLENPADQTQANVHKPDVIVIADSPSVVSRSHKQGPEESSSVVSRPHKQGPDPSIDSGPLRDSPDKLRASCKAESHNDPQPVKPSDQVRHLESYKSVERVNHQSNVKGSISAQDVGHDTGTRPIPQEGPIPESYPRGPRIHPDRRQEIVAANTAILNPPSSDSKIRQENRGWEFVRHPHEPETVRPRAPPRPRSVSPDLRFVSSHRPLERHPREPVQLSGANGIPKAPGRSFPDPRTSLRSPVDYNKSPESSRYNKNAYSPCMPAREHVGHRNADWWRGAPDDSLNRKMVPQDRIPAQWPSRPPSPVYSAHRHRLPPRARSPSPPPRRLSSYQDFQRGPLPPDLHRPERARPPPASNRVLAEDWPSKPPHPSDLGRRNTTSRFDTYRPSSSSPMVAIGPRLQDSRRGETFAPRDQGPRHIDYNEVQPMRSQAVKTTSFLPDIPKTSSSFTQPDFYRPPPRDVIAPKLSPRHTVSSRHEPIIDLDRVMSKDEPPLRSLTEKKSNHLPSEPVSRGIPSAETSHSSTLPGPDTAHDHGTSKSIGIDDAGSLASLPNKPSTLVTPVAHDKNQATCASSGEMKDSVDNGDKVPPEVIIIPSPPAPSSPKQPVSLVKRLGPVVAYSSESDQLTPPTKRHRRNPAEENEVPDKSNDIVDNLESSSLEKEHNANKNVDPRSKDAADKNNCQSEPEAQTRQIDGVPEIPPSPSQASQDKGISLRGRAARKSAEFGLAERSGPKIEDKIISESAPTGGGSLRDRIQDLNIPAVQPGSISHTDPPNPIPQRPVVDHPHETPQAWHKKEDGQAPPRHITERISGFRAPIRHSPSSNGNYRPPRYVPRQSDSGWSGRKAKYP